MPSASINPGASPITLINVFTVAPDKQDELVRLLSEATEKAMKRLPGFVSRPTFIRASMAPAW